jgi:hypothetical protein
VCIHEFLQRGDRVLQVVGLLLQQCVLPPQMRDDVDSGVVAQDGDLVERQPDVSLRLMRTAGGSAGSQAG